ncbi:vestigial like 4 like [Antennarius striatus]|uniref:vestigial like 4 like n=1 Tax=Antennarius striatus TaxID=241820 RepID=UPI0035B3F274
MAVANFHYITRMSSGFKVYILEGQSHLRSEDRFRHLTSDRARGPTGCPIKRKRSHERGLTLEERRERVLSRSAGKAPHREAPASPGVFNRPPSSTSTWSPTATPATPLPPHVYYTPAMDEPLALIKKPRKESDGGEDKTRTPAAAQIQVRPSVITCVSSSRHPPGRPEVHRGSPSGAPQSSCDHVVDEHFQRSLGINYPKAPPQQRSVSVPPQQLSISVSVDDHFAKALGATWQQIKSKSSSCSSTPPSSPSITHSPTYSPHRSHKESVSSASPASSHWSIN